MNLRKCGIKFVVVVNLLVGSWCYGQFIESGKIYYERKTNLQKINSEHMSSWLKDIIDKNPYKVDKFVLSFDNTKSLFEPTEPTGLDFEDLLTVKNSVYCDYATLDRMTVMNVMGQLLYVRDTIAKIPWKMTDQTRNLAGYNCKMAFFHKNDSTTIYAWYSEEIVPSIGPETFYGLPGAILGLATEDGGIVYFAKKVENQPIEEKAFVCDPKKNKVYSIQGIRTEMLKRMGNNPTVTGMLDAYFFWY